MESIVDDISALQKKAKEFTDSFDYENAVKCYEQVLLNSKSLSESDLIKLHCDIAEAYNELEEYEQVIKHYKTIASTTNIPLASKINCKLGQVYLKIKDYKNSIESYMIALELTKKLLGEDHKSIPTLLTFLAMAHQEGEDLKSAVDVYKAAISIYKKQGASEELGYEYYLLAKCYEEYGETKEAKENIKIAEEVLIKAKGQNSNMVADCYGLLAIILVNNKEYKEALEYLTKTMDIWDINGFDDYEKIADTYVQKGFCNYKLERYNLAINNYKLGLENRRKFSSIEDEWTAMLYYGIAKSYYKKKDEIVNEWLLKAYTIMSDLNIKEPRITKLMKKIVPKQMNKV